MFDDGSLLYEQGYSITVNTSTAPLYYYFDYDTRSYSINMDFQHFHQFYEIMILLDGKAKHIIEGEPFEIHPFDIVLLRPAVLHKSQYLPGAPMKRLIVNFSLPTDQNALSPLIAKALACFEQPLPIVRLPEEARSEVFAPINHIFRLSRQPDELRDLMLHAKFIEFLCALTRVATNNLYQPALQTDSISGKIYSITGYIHANYPQDLSLEEIAKQFYISPYYLSHQFKNVTGFTLVNYIQMTRVRNAQQLLLYTDMKISQITDACGFTSFSQFNRVFNKFCHTSPSSFRAVGRSGNCSNPMEPEQFLQKSER